MNTYFKTAIFVFSIMAGFVLFNNTAYATILSMESRETEIALGESFLVTIHLNSEREIINAIDAVINYSPEVLEVIEVSRGGSLFTLWPEEPTYDDTAGTITFVGGIPNGSLVVDGIVATITFRSRAIGGVEIGFDEDKTSILLNDGKGTKASLSARPKILQVIESNVISIISPTHPYENSWYSNVDFTVNWTAEPGAVYSYVVTSRADEVPDNERESIIGKVTFQDLSDGVQYFILKEQLPGEDWQLVGKRRVQIDSTAPFPLTVLVSRNDSMFDGNYFLTFSTTDKTSGIARYDVVEGLSPQEDTTSPYVLKDQTLKQSLVVRAFDKAGNSVDYTVRGTSTIAELRSIKYIPYIIVGAIILLLGFIFNAIRKKKHREV